MCGPTPLQAFDAPENNPDEDGEDDEKDDDDEKSSKKNKVSSDNLRKTKVCSKCEGAR